MSRGHYAILELTPDASYDQITKAYSQLRPLYDRDPARLAQIDEAWRVLSNPITKKQHDESLRKGVATPPRPPESARGDPSPAERRPRALRRRTEVVEVHTGVDAPASARRRRTEVVETGESPPAMGGEGHHRSGRRITEAMGVDEETLTPPPRQERAKPARQVTEVAASPSEPSAAELHLTYKGVSQVFSLPPGTYAIGRPSRKGPHPDIPLPDPSAYVSRRHATIYFENGQWLVKDNGSDNGSCLNGARLDPYRAYPLAHGDVIEIEERQLGFRLK